jgi:hypothetical protein
MIRFVAKHSSAPAPADCSYVAFAITRSEVSQTQKQSPEE